MKSKRSRLAVAGVLALAISVTVGLASGSVAEAKKKKTKATTAVVSKTVNTLIPDRAPGAGTQYGQLSVPLPLTAKKFKGKVVAPDSVSVTFQTTGDDANSAGDLIFFLRSPKGRTIELFPDFGSLGGQSIGPLTLTTNSPVGTCNTATPPCPNPFQTLNRPFAGTAGESYLAIFNGTQVKGTWTFIAHDTTNNRTSVLNSVKLAITTA